MKYPPKKLLPVLICLFCFTRIFAQPLLSYKPIAIDSFQLLNIKNAIHDHYLKDSASQTGDNKKYIVNLYRERYQYLESMFTEKELMASSETDSYLASLVNEIMKSNPELKKLGTHFLFSRVYWPNAFSTGEGTIVFNLGLFAKLFNESQVIFVLCHELAHLYLDHGNKAILQYVNTVYSDDFQRELKDIKKTKYEKNKELDKLSKSITFKSRRHGREHETEADSMGLVFMQHSGFNVKESLTCLALLDSIDSERYVPGPELERYFNFAEYPFQKSWVKKEAAFFGGIADLKLTGKEKDSLKTHPDCKIRVARLTPSVEKLNTVSGSNFVVSESKFNELRQRFRYEIIEFCFTSKRVSHALFYAMEFLKDAPGDPYLVNMIGKCFASFYENQKTHTLNQVVDLPSPYFDKNYNSLLEFLQNIRIDDMSAIAYYFMQSYQATLGSNEDFTKVFNRCKGNFKK